MANPKHRNSMISGKAAGGPASWTASFSMDSIVHMDFLPEVQWLTFQKYTDWRSIYMDLVSVNNAQSIFFPCLTFPFLFSIFEVENAQSIFDGKWKNNGVENGKKTVYGSPGRGEPRLSGDVQSPNVSKSMGSCRVFMRENIAWQIEEFGGPQRGPRVPGAPGWKMGKKTEWKKKVRSGCPRGGKRKRKTTEMSNTGKNNVLSIFHTN